MKKKKEQEMTVKVFIGNREVTLEEAREHIRKKVEKSSTKSA